LTGALSWFSQIILFTVAFIAVYSLASSPSIMRSLLESFLVLWQYETPRRSKRVWWFDILKQTWGLSRCCLFLSLSLVSHDPPLGSIIQRFSSIGIAIVFSRNTNVNACVWFLTNYHADTIVATFIHYLIILQLDKFFGEKKMPCGYLKSGYYGSPPALKSFFAQLCLWSIIVSSTKLFVTLLVYLFGWILNYITEFILLPLRNHPDAKTVILMAIYPIILSSLVFVVQDKLIRASPPPPPPPREIISEPMQDISGEPLMDE
jgi:hypothetical protein